MEAGFLPAVGLCALVLLPGPAAMCRSLPLLSPISATQGPTQLEVVTVPWLGDPTNDHMVFAGGSLVLQGVAHVPGGCNITAATWDPGDGSGPQPVPFGNPRALELVHVYQGFDFQPYVATLSVTTDACGTAIDTFRVRVVPRRLEVDVNMAIDRGLWHLHKRQILSASGTVPTGYWAGQNRAADTASAVLAMEVNGHLESGDRGEDPYVETVARGLAHTFTELSRIDIGAQPAGDPDSNGNGFGLEVLEGARPVYIGGQVVDAIVASNTPFAVAPTGIAPGVQGRYYLGIVRDLMDAYAWGQVDSGPRRGGWRYDWNSDADNSASQWWAIGGLALERVLGTPVAQFVKDENLNHWIPTTQDFDGSNTGVDGLFGYRFAGEIVDALGMNTTPSGLVQMILDGETSSSARFVAAQRFMLRNWAVLIGRDRIYGMFAIAKAMRLAVPEPIILMDGTFDWYGSDTTPPPPDPPDPIDGLARRLVNTQQADGSWDDGRWVFDDLATAWAIVILSPTILQLPPRAICEMDPEVTAVDVEIRFDGSQSSHLDPARQIVSWQWDFEDDGLFDASGERVTHSYPVIGTYNTRLRVTDDNDPPLTHDSTCVVNIIVPPIPPDADPGGPYVFCIGTNEPFILDGTASSDPDGRIVTYGWEFTPQPGDASFDDSPDPAVNVTGIFSALGPGFYDVGLRVVDNDNQTDTDFTTVVVRAQPPCPPPGNPFMPFCLAEDPEDAPCPCGNNGAPGNGCANSSFPGGANLSASGSPSIAQDTIRLTVVDQHPGSLSLFLQATGQTDPGRFGDGLRCISGLRRLYIVKNMHASSVFAPSWMSIPSINDPNSRVAERSAALGDVILPATRRGYQVYYRDPDPNFCPPPEGRGFNITNGVWILWGP